MGENNEEQKRSALRRFFFPKSGASRWRKAAPYLVVAGGIVAAMLLTIVTWQVTNANGFCGQVCHDVMYPYVEVYHQSVHSQVDCVECHLGRTPLTDQLPRKFVHARELYALITGDYEVPLEATTLRPSRDTCELCHYPPQFFDDSLREVRHYQSDRENTPVSTWLIMKTGGGLEREGLGFGIHWHVENEIYYYSPDDKETIPWMRVVDAQGEVTEYADIDFQPPQGFPEEAELRLMDCIDCHNRTGHQMLSPQQAVDGALERGQIPSTIPYIREQAIEVLGRDYETTEEALEAIEGLDDWYDENYAPAASLLQDEIAQAIEMLKALYQSNFFPEKGYSWQTYPDNTDHQDWPGCFRCHDGRHVSEDDEVVRIECNLCHSIPEVVVGGGGPTISLAKGPEPASHRDTAWLHRHHVAFDQTCALCHTVSNPGGADNSSFCSNSACHGTEWVYADLDAPDLAEELGIEPAPPPEVEIPPSESLTFATVIGPLLTERCGDCHGVAAGLDVTTYGALMEGSDNGPVVVPGDAEASLIVEVMREEHFAQLDTEALDLLIEWINEGAPQE